MKRGDFWVAGLAAVLALVLTACGDSPTAPSGVTLRGVAVPDSGSAAAEVAARSDASARSSGGTITVTVQEDPSLEATLSSGGGTFELQGLPAGTVTLIFTRDGVTIGTVTITSVPTEGEIDLVVKLSPSGVVVVKLEISGREEAQATQPSAACLIEGGKVGQGIQLEGSVSAPGGGSFTMNVNGLRAAGTVTIDYSGASFSCAGKKGTCDASLVKAGQKVHVSGNLTTCSASEASVKASELKFQK